MTRRTSAYAALILLSLSASARAATPIGFTVNLQRAGQPVAVAFRTWIPDGVNRIKGLLLSLPGSNGDTRNITTNGSWQAMLPGMGFGIVGVRDVAGNVDITYWGTTPAETASNLQAVMDAVADASSHPEIKNAPVMLAGESKGGFASSYIASMVPNRVLGVVGDKGFGGISSANVDGSALSQVPGMMIVGSGDPTVTPSSLNSTFQLARLEGARLAQAIEWGVGHASSNSQIRYAFIAQAIRARYPAGQVPSLTPGLPLQLVANPPAPWLGEANVLNFGGGQVSNPTFLPINGPTISPLSAGVLDRIADSWLPNKAMALVYRSQNDATFNTILKPLSISALNAVSNAVNTGQPIDVGITLSGVTGNIELYHNDDLVGTFNNVTGLQHFLFTPTINGLHTFIATASYTKSGTNMFASSYVTVGVGGLPMPEPEGAALAACVVACGVVLGRSRSARERVIC